MATKPSDVPEAHSPTLDDIKLNKNTDKNKPTDNVTLGEILRNVNLISRPV